MYNLAKNVDPTFSGGHRIGCFEERNEEKSYSQYLMAAVMQMHENLAE
jgi:hypothetical protein